MGKHIEAANQKKINGRGWVWRNSRFLEGDVAKIGLARFLECLDVAKDPKLEEVLHT